MKTTCIYSNNSNSLDLIIPLKNIINVEDGAKRCVAALCDRIDKEGFKCLGYKRFKYFDESTHLPQDCVSITIDIHSHNLDPKYIGDRLSRDLYIFIDKIAYHHPMQGIMSFSKRII